MLIEGEDAMLTSKLSSSQSDFLIRYIVLFFPLFLSLHCEFDENDF